jgi:polar amino acid transport system substrate-binding protein
VGVIEASTSQGVLARELRAAHVVPVPALEPALERLRRGELDAFATNKAILFELGERLPGSRVLAGRWGLEHLALGIPKGRGEALSFLVRFARSVSRDGLLDRAVARAGLRGTVRPGAAP